MFKAKETGEDPEKFVEIGESLPLQEEELNRLTRETRVNEQIYASLLEKLEKARISKTLEEVAKRQKAEG